MKKIVWFFLFLLIIELVLQGFSLLRFDKDIPTPSSNKALSIVILGESTSQRQIRSGVDQSWPSQLERLLKQSGKKVEVHNLSLPAITSGILLKRFFEFEKQHKVDLVISMMGVNDSGFLKYQMDDTYFEFKLYKIWKYFQFYFLSSQIKYQGLKHEPSCWKSFQLARNDKNAKALPQCFVFFKYLKLMIQTHAYQAQTCQQWLAPAVAYSASMDDTLLSQMAFCYKEEAPFLLKAQLKKRGIKLSGKQVQLTGLHYQDLGLELAKKNIPWLVMSYPTEDIQTVKRFWRNSPSSNIHFLENKTIFESLLQKHPYEEVFRDQFQGTWGHTTGLGHKAIADNVFRFLQESSLAD